MKTLLSELRRRKVFRALAWYAAAAWCVVQIAATTVGPLDLPLGLVKATILLAAAGFPLVAVLSWTYDLRRERRVVAAGGARRPARSWWGPSFWLASALVAALSTTALGLWKLYAHPLLFETRGIAVLTPELIPADPETAWIGAALQDSAVAALLSLENLRIIAPSSLRPYTSTPDLGRMAAELKVSHGARIALAVSGNRLHGTVHIFELDTKAVVGEFPVEGSSTDLPALGLDIANIIAGSLLSNSPAPRTNITPVAPAAYIEYRKAVEILRSGVSASDYSAAVERLRSALALDADLAPARAALVRALAELHNQTAHDTKATGDGVQCEEARALLETSDDDLGGNPDWLVAQGYFHYYCDEDFASAVDAFAKAKHLAPNHADAWGGFGRVLRRTGNLLGASEAFSEAVRLDPHSTVNWFLLRQTAIWNRNYLLAQRALDEQISTAHGIRDLEHAEFRAHLRWIAWGDGDTLLEVSRATMARGTPATILVPYAFDLLLSRDEQTEALAVLSSATPTRLDGLLRISEYGVFSPALARAMAYHKGNDLPAARKEAEHALGELDLLRTDKRRIEMIESLRLLALVFAGQETRALREMNMQPAASPDAILHPELRLAARAAVFAANHREEDAVQELRVLLSSPMGWSWHEFRYRRHYFPWLQGHPEFERLHRQAALAILLPKDLNPSP